MIDRVVVVMGPSGCGKSTVGRLVADRVKAPFFEADDFHAAAARTAMSEGRGLTNEDRHPWIARIAAAINAADSPRAVLACSALNPTIRGWLSQSLDAEAVFALLNVPEDVLARRLSKRAGHFAGPSLLPSQIAALDASDTVVFDGTRPAAELASAIAALL